MSNGPAMVAGVDSSTQSCKIVFCDLESGQIVRTARAAHPDGTEVSADAWLRAFQEATADPSLLEGVQALAVGGQQHGMVTLDDSGELVRDALLWNDNRSAPDAVDLIAELGGAQAWAEAVGSVPVASMTVSKIRWLARCEPGNAARTAGVVLPHDWLTWQIGGRSFEPVTDRGDASGTCYFDASANAYRRDLIELGIGHDLAVPRVAAPREIVGTTPSGVALAPGTGDNMAAGLGLGLSRGMGAVSVGTSGTAFTMSGEQTHDGTGVVAGFADATGEFPTAGLHVERCSQPGCRRHHARLDSGRVQRRRHVRACGQWRCHVFSPIWRASGRRRCRTPAASLSDSHRPTLRAPRSRGAVELGLRTEDPAGPDRRDQRHHAHRWRRSVGCGPSGRPGSLRAADRFY